MNNQGSLVLKFTSTFLLILIISNSKFLMSEPAVFAYDPSLSVGKSFYWGVSGIHINDPKNITSIDSKLEIGSIIEIVVDREIPSEIVDEWSFDGTSYSSSSYLHLLIDDARHDLLQGSLQDSIRFGFTKNLSNFSSRVRMHLVFPLAVLRSNNEIITIEDDFSDSNITYLDEGDQIIHYSTSGSLLRTQLIDLKTGFVLYQRLEISETLCCIENEVARFEFEIELNLTDSPTNFWSEQSLIPSSTTTSIPKEESTTDFRPAILPFYFTLVFLLLTVIQRKKIIQ